MTREEIMETAAILMKMSTDAYLKCKYMLLAEARATGLPGTICFFEKLFALADSNRPLLIEMH